MSLFIELHLSLLDSSKPLRLSRALDVTRHEAIGLIAEMWLRIVRAAPDTGLVDWDAEELAGWVGWQGDPDALAGALTSDRIRLLDAVDGPHGPSYQIHNYDQYSVYLRRRMKEADRKRRKRREEAETDDDDAAPASADAAQPVRGQSADAVRTSCRHVAPKVPEPEPEPEPESKPTLHRPVVQFGEVADLEPELPGWAGWPLMLPPKCITALRRLMPITRQELEYARAETERLIDTPTYSYLCKVLTTARTEAREADAAPTPPPARQATPQVQRIERLRAVGEETGVGRPPDYLVDKILRHTIGDVRRIATSRAGEDNAWQWIDSDLCGIDNVGYDPHESWGGVQ